MPNNFKKESFIVCCALPYANGPLHIGHLAGCYIPGDIYTRFRRMQGHDVHFVCGSDEHGTPITIRAAKEGITPKQVADKYNKIFKEEFADFNIEFDIFSHTTHECHYKRSQDFFLNLMKNNLIEKKTELRLYCEKDKQFLPDRYVMGTCPKCANPNARGDQCEKCGTWYEPEKLVNPICQICKETSAVLKETTHWYISLNKLEEKLKAWLESKTHWRKNVLGYAFQPIKAELAPRSITRDMSWGIPVPLEEAKDKVLYVWFDAPIGYISASEHWSIEQGQPDKWKQYWENKDTKLIHFIGKDNIIFHTVVWPSVLMGDGRYILPDLVCGNEFLNLEGEKISTSRNFAIWAGEAAKIIDTDLMRFYLTRISPETSDSNFTWKEFQQRVNGELADVMGNLVNRTLTFINKHFEGKLSGGKFEDCEPSIKDVVNKHYSSYVSSLDEGLSRVASESVVELARELNALLQNLAPWKMVKEDKEKTAHVLTSMVFGIRAVAVMLSPICPNIGRKMLAQLNYLDDLNKDNSFNLIFNEISKNHQISTEIAPIVTKIEDEFIAEQIEKLAQNMPNP